MTEADLRAIAVRVHPAIRSGRCVAWVGSGFSVCAGYLDWETLINRLCSSCSVPPPEILGKPDFTLLMEKADECKKANLCVYQETLGEYFGRPPFVTRIAYTLLMKLPFRGYVTTNYDPLLAYAAAHSGLKDLYHFPDLPVTKLGGSTQPIYYIHGLAYVDGQPCGKNLVLSKTEFHDAYQGIVGSFLDALFTYSPVLFLGCRLLEPRIRDALRKAKENQDSIHKARPIDGNPCKLILLNPDPVRERDKTDQEVISGTKTDEVFAHEILTLAELDIEVLRYDPEDGTHREIERILEYLCELENVPAVPEPRMGLPEDLPRL